MTRADLHVHSAASDAPVIAALRPFGCPESYSPPERVYESARAAGMDLVTITDHDTIAGVMSLVERGFDRLIVGEEVTTHFPEDRCRLHVLVWGLSPDEHDQIGSLGLRDDVYEFAAWLREHNLAHSLAHPLYVQNGRFGLWHLERATLLFKGFELLNGAHSGSHRDVVSRWLDRLTPARVQALIDKHGIQPAFSRIWVKAVTAGSDDHAMLNVGRTWTEIQADEHDAPLEPAEFLRLVMSGRAAVGGQAGHGALLAHQLAAVGINYYAERLHDSLSPRGRAVGAMVARFAGVDAPRPSRAALILDAVARRFKPKRHRRTPTILRALRECLGPALDSHDPIRAALRDGSDRPPMADHEAMAAFTDDLIEALMRAMAPAADRAIRKSDRSQLADVALGYAALAAAAAPHVFSLFHQNKERRLLQQIQRTCDGDGHAGSDDPDSSLRVMLFTDTLGDVNGVCRFICDMGDQAAQAGRRLRIVTSTRLKTPDAAHVTNLPPVLARSMPGYGNLEVVLPPLVRMLRLADRFQPDVIHVSTPGPVGLVGLLAARMMRVPVVGVYHTDFPAYVDHLFDDPTYTRITSDYMKFFYRPFATILSRSTDYMDSLCTLGIPRRRMVRLAPGVALDSFGPEHRRTSIWSQLGVSVDSVKVLYTGRVSVEKNLPMLTGAWPAVRAACAERGVTADLIVVGDGPYRTRMESRLAGKGVHMLGFRHGGELSAIYASADLFVFPSTTDTLGQVVLESQASGLPVIVSDRGGPKEVVDDGITGFVCRADRPRQWVDAIVRLVCDGQERQRMGRSAQTRAQRYSIDASFEQFWQIHEDAAAADIADSAVATPAATNGSGAARTAGVGDRPGAARPAPRSS